MPIDEYLAALSKELWGPRRRKADLLAEARDHLTDATEAFEADGLDRYDAEKHAVAEFGTLEEVAPGYRAELAVSQGRLTAMLLFASLIVQPLIWRQGVWAWSQDAPTRSPLNDFLQDLVRGVGSVVIAGAVLAVLAAGIGMRHPVVRDHVSRVTGIFALVGATAVGLISLAMPVSSQSPVGSLDLTVVVGFVVLPLFLVALHAGRCLRLARA
ncbi:hypothetical protein EV651_103281 [Kribbella sp. VKM Ac-2571]|uniref:permease prefix domain 1-containing protein n=1 Tax=Kribbella sp. VKM Ac-2571 TaxID=2512222 RepID=UPI00105D0ED5|nr:permease prefix domain 1-containing protein [Kribbella sp. VKM Ac-2571]TDO67369.1 hypothetical protein EV651_103281 [Kribbella sp. VKM Ac-2571]